MSKGETRKRTIEGCLCQFCSVVRRETKKETRTSLLSSSLLYTQDPLSILFFRRWANDFVHQNGTGLCVIAVYVCVVLLVVRSTIGCLDWSANLPVGCGEPPNDYCLYYPTSTPPQIQPRICIRRSYEVMMGTKFSPSIFDSRRDARMMTTTTFTKGSSYDQNSQRTSATRQHTRRGCQSKVGDVV